MIHLTGASSKILTAGQHIEDVMDRRPMVTKAKKLLGFAPSQDLEDCVAKTIDWMRESSVDKSLSGAA